MSYSFYGAKVVDFNLQGSFGSDLSLDINLTECEFSNPSFVAPTIGSPVKFQTDTFSFYGILDTVKADNNYMYSAQINNGMHIIGGVELILNDYFGSVNSVPNLINIFGYKENNLGFGGSEINNAGISWSIIASTLTTIINNISGGSYGGPITYKGYKYKIDLSALPAIPNYYRINNDSINLVEFISEVCSAGGHDFFITLLEPSGAELLAGWSGTFKVNTISRIDEPVAGKVQEFIESAVCVTSKNYGLEVRKDVHSKFVVGANLERIYFNYPQNSGDNSFDGGLIDRDEYANDTILPYFGVDKNNNIIVGFTPSGEPDEYYFNIDVSDIKGLEGSGDYFTCLSELRAARKGRNSWENYLCTRDANEYVIDPSGTVTVDYRFKTKLFDNKDTAPFLIDGSGFHNIPKYGYMFLYQIGETGLINQFYPFTGIAAPSSGNRILRYPSKGAPNYYFQRATNLKISSGRRIAYARMFESDLYPKSLDNEKIALAYEKFKSENGILWVENQQLESSNRYMSSRFKDLEESFNDNITDQVYRKIKGYADTYYNKKFMVSIPFTLGAIEPESTTIRMSQEPINEGYLDESVWPTAYDSGLIPDISGINTLITPDNKFYPFVKYENCVVIDNSGVIRGNPGDIYKSLYDFSEISASDKIFSTPYPYTEPSGAENNWLGVTLASGFTVFDCWVKCNVDEKIYFHDSQTLFGPRAVIEVPGSVKRNIGASAATYAGALMQMFNISKQNGGVFAADPSVSGEYFKKQFDKIGSDDSFNHDGEPIQYADLYAIPLRSKLLSYGPWYAVGADGKVSYERNTDLNPWNYGGFTAMNTAGLSRVQDGITNQTFSEVGSVTVQGLPTLNFGDPLIAAGPYINSVSCSFGQQGKTTTYGFQAWSSHRSLSKLAGYSIERNKNLNKTMMDIKSNFREGLKNGRFKNAGDFYNKVSNRFIDISDYTRRDRPSTSSKVISAEMNGPSATVVIQPNYNAAAQSYTDYQNKAFVSLDGLFRPYSTVQKSGWPSFVMPESSGSGEINVLTLNPIQSGVDFDVVSRGTGYQDGGLLSEDTLTLNSISGVIPARSIGFRMPIIGVGWGYDTDGNPVPSGSGPNGFADDYLYNSSKWKAGPIDLRWDQDSGLWAAAGNSVNIALAYDDIDAAESLFVPATGYIYDYIPDVPNATGRLGTKKVGYAFDLSLGAIASGTILYYVNKGNINHIIYVGCFADPSGLALLRPPSTGSPPDPSGSGDPELP